MQQVKILNMQSLKKDGAKKNDGLYVDVDEHDDVKVTFSFNE